MPNLAASIKSVRQTKKRTTYNSRIKRKYRGAVKDFNQAVEAGDSKAANEKLPRVYKTLDKATKGGIIKKGTSSRTKSRLAKKLNTLASSNVETAKATA
jgi:small subunit ribosomal protein S20